MTDTSSPGHYTAVDAADEKQNGYSVKSSTTFV